MQMNHLSYPRLCVFMKLPELQKSTKMSLAKLQVCLEMGLV